MSDKPLISRRRVTPDTLNDVMEFDHVIRVHRDGSVSEPAGIWAPDLYDGVLGDLDDRWRLMRGYSGQWMYSGPIMHPSEFIGGTMARDILAQPGLYVAIVNYTTEYADGCDYCLGLRSAGEGPCDVHDIDGWAVAYIDDSLTYDYETEGL